MTILERVQQAINSADLSAEGPASVDKLIAMAYYIASHRGRLL